MDVGVTVEPPIVSAGTVAIPVPILSVTASAVAPSVTLGGGAQIIAIPVLTVSVTVIAPYIYRRGTPLQRTFVINSSQRTVIVPREDRVFRPATSNRRVIT
jgi:hypothetical protein